ncbi:MAG: ribosome small subunit-dependent GTPase A [Eggerthellaceae bacterium]|jgi:ribosome biogenesis GTPase|nr:ribosome small subunit-dependent GTPase A [Eggerthellaceae bacterium]
MGMPVTETGVVVKLDRGFPLVRLADGRELRCEHATSLVKGSDQRAVVGDNVRISLPDGHDKGIIEETLPRRTSFVRKDPTERALPQTLAANFDLVIVAQPIEDINTRRLERELVLAHETGAEVMVVLTKADLMASPEEVEEVRRRIDGFVGNDELLAISDRDEASVQRLAGIIAEGDKTAVLIGRSGVGKSSLVNMLVGSDVQKTTEVRGDGKGRHTTVSREIIDLPSGGRIIDMPGVRGLGLWDADEGIGAAFSDIEELASSCRFRDCTHTNEPGCAVRAAVEAGELAASRLESYVRLREESAQVKTRREEAERIRSRRGHPRRRR